MSRKFQREEKEIERLEIKIRELKKQNQSLHKRLKQLNKGYYKFLYAETDEEDKEAVKAAKKTARKMCWECGVGEYAEVIIVNRRFRQCTNCGKRGKTTIL